MSSEEEVEKDYLQEEMNLLGKRYTIQILDALNYPKSSKELINNHDIPQATAHRRITQLHNAEYIEEVGTSTDIKTKSESKLYRRTEKVSEVLTQAATILSEKDEQEFIESILDS